MPFDSRSQVRACFAAKDPNWDCHEWAAATPSIKALPERKKKPKGQGRKTATYAGRAPLLENMSALLENALLEKRAMVAGDALLTKIASTPSSVLAELEPATPTLVTNLDPREAYLFKLAGEILAERAKQAGFGGQSILAGSLQPKQLGGASQFLQQMQREHAKPQTPSPMGTHPAQAQPGNQLPGAGHTPNANPIQAFGGLATNPMNVNGNAALGTHNNQIKVGATLPPSPATPAMPAMLASRPSQMLSKLPPKPQPSPGENAVAAATPAPLPATAPIKLADDNGNGVPRKNEAPMPPRGEGMISRLFKLPIDPQQQARQPQPDPLHKGHPHDRHQAMAPSRFISRLIAQPR